MPRLKPDEIYRRVARSKIARLGTVDPEYGVHLVPVTFALSGETIFSAVDHKPKSSRRLRRIENIERNHHVTLLVDHYDDDWTKLWWCRVSGDARVFYQGAEFEQALDALQARYAQYREVRPDGPVVAIRVTRWTGWSAVRV